MCFFCSEGIAESQRSNATSIKKRFPKVSSLSQIAGESSLWYETFLDYFEIKWSLRSMLNLKTNLSILIKGTLKCYKSRGGGCTRRFQLFLVFPIICIPPPEHLCHTPDCHAVIFSERKLNLKKKIN